MPELRQAGKGGTSACASAVWNASLIGALEVVRIAVRGWTVPLAMGYLVAEAAVTLPLAWILYDHRIFNPEFLVDVNGGWTVPDSFYTVAVLGVLVVGAIEVVKRFRDARR